MDDTATRHVRTLFVSDIHLGTRGCQPDLLLDFLKHHDADTIYLVGDIVDGWRLKAGWYWPQSHNDVVQKLLRKVRKGARVIYVPGNHDEFLRDYVGSNFGGIEIVEEAVHVTAAGQRILVLHGDKFDMVIRHAPWLAKFGDVAYDLAIWLSAHVSRARRRMGLPYWSFSAWSKGKVKRAVNFISAFQDAVVADAERHGVTSVLCGHIHQPAMERIRGVEYINTGDWVESCTAVAEHHDGRLELIRWTSPAHVEATLRPPRRLATAA
ncbi:UDP-2,3-diacylglucosamine diphosphatase [Alsobacter sp. SYSU M60028]|uniref:UDP-2,3-diacylglucosamine diphosphatase n=1 Tax=Alsobacter ponti TaxID=2962936 RepID=A0ABT1L9F1_9HYPH|nr:UDP-2,3-diacylglucosamine diphosphatase [Alsobacter ponti]MCP8937370.1 UDP-2,3-diacylglucosamine diphosphatase [Alsobacter ponti]